MKYNTDFYGGTVNNPDLAWCAVFIWWLFKMVGWVEAVLRDGVKTASCPYLVGTFKAKGQWITSGYRRGDVVFFRWSGSSGYDHVAIIDHVNADGSLVTIEGNTSVTSDDNGGAVMRRDRTLQYVVGAGRPDYLQQESTKPEPSGESTYTVKPGDALSIIAQDNGTTVDVLVELNGIENPSLIYPGQIIKLPAAAHPETNPDAGMYAVTTKPGNILNIRSGPGTEYEDLGDLQSGAIVEVFSKSGGWCKIKYGYCSAEYLARADLMECTANGGLYIRSGPGIGYQVLGLIKTGEKVYAWGLSEGWYRVNHDGDSGWSSAEYLR